ncbi:MAG: DUF4426 domain-containing protein [Gammaproteobacteria bacterium]|nr:MAG: DUF4426 domain-containing protein [Gammaproteobacteria bacterium]
MRMPGRFFLILGSLLAALVSSLPVRAENMQDFGVYVVHYNALTTDMLPPKVARENHIQRSRSRGMLNVVVLKKVLGATGQPVKARVEGKAYDLTGVAIPLKFREIREGNAIYYIAEFKVHNEQRLRFDLLVHPQGEQESLRVVFRKQFFTE